MRQFTFACLSGLLLASPLGAQQAADTVAPEEATEAGGGFAALSPAVAAALEAKAAGRPVEATHWMIAVANPHAAEAGAAVLRAGGTAADAMVAAQTVLGLVEPQSSGLGGGAFLVWYDAASGDLTTLDGRETAPLDARPRLFQDTSGQPLGFYDAVVGGRSVGTPGTPALLAEAHRRWGRTDWRDLFRPAIDLAEGGFAVSARLAALVEADAERLARFPATAEYFLPGGQPLAAGQRLTNPAYADTLRQLADNGAAGFYAGPVAADIVRTVQEGAGDNPGVLSGLDLALYQVRERAPICVPYRTYEVCGMGPPSSGALTVGQILGMLNSFAMPGPDSPEAWRLIGDASRLAFADRGRYMADEDFVPMPTKGLVDPAYLAERAKLLEGGDALPEVAPGNPVFDHALLQADDEAIEFPSTSHISIVDSYGNVLSMTTTIENGFGSRLMVRGFLLNNELTDFSFRTHKDGLPIANRVEPGKRPRSSMAPTIVMAEGKPVLAIGSPGGSRIIGYVAQAIVAWADWGMDVQQAVALPHAVNRFGTYDLEAGTGIEALAPELEEMGYEVAPKVLNSGLHAIEIGHGLKGGADPRREGIALGD
ncbi:gamma-glutamyltransferase [Pseudodonghicola xiamenensis]|uniref:Glutathione hydrolase proenzyme n=1 Tax=Pseudodonghicola xiamenensis TaxID=337702 RepID=A0A8J3H7Y5_9RHOB|nr:gamma-glutamyltransferase [Pseudodonghicola xiamenensis]GHG89158.1 gamma-glutamyltransferase [Pseudodonghicola xiamenensis]